MNQLNEIQAALDKLTPKQQAELKRMLMAMICKSAGARKTRRTQESGK